MPDGERNLTNIEYDREKVEETVLALLWLTLGADGPAWKSHDCAGSTARARLHLRPEK